MIVFSNLFCFTFFHLKHTFLCLDIAQTIKISLFNSPNNLFNTPNTLLCLDIAQTIKISLFNTVYCLFNTPNTLLRIHLYCGKVRRHFSQIKRYI